MRLKIILSTAVIYLVLIIGSVAFAQDNLVLSISPVRFELEAKRGQTVAQEVTLTNSSSHQVVLEATAQDFVAEGESGRPRFVPEEKSAWSMSHWIKANPESVTLAPGEQKKVTMLIKVPKDAEPGGHYAAILFSSAPSGAGTTAVVAKMGSLILLKVGGKIKESAKASLAAPRLVETGPMNFSLRFENDGNMHAKPKGTITISRLWGKQIKNLSLGGENVLPKSKRLFAAKWKDVPPIGVFVAQAKLSYGEKNSIATAPKVIFFVLPWRITLAGLLLFSAGVVFSLLLSRRKKN